MTALAHVHPSAGSGWTFLVELDAYVRHRIVIRMPGGCWVWANEVNNRGYPVLGGILVHRKLDEEIHGAIPAGLHLDHLCRDILCVRPAHMERVTNEENQRRRHPNFRLKSCPVGHDMAITRVRTRRGGHVCGDCIMEGP